MAHVPHILIKFGKSRTQIHVLSYLYFFVETTSTTPSNSHNKPFKCLLYGVDLLENPYESVYVAYIHIVEVLLSFYPFL